MSPEIFYPLNSDCLKIMPFNTEKLNQLKKHQNRRRAVQSCDGCKKRKRACKRYNQNGERVFDKSTPCTKCLMAGLPCETNAVRKKRKFFCVSESSMIQLKCLTKIFKGIFPECDPQNAKDRENIAKLLCVKLPDEADENDSLDQDHVDDSNLESDYEIDTADEVSEDKPDFAEITKHKEFNQNNKNDDNGITMRFAQVGQDSSDRLFEALIEVQKRRSSLDASGIVTPSVKQDSILYQSEKDKSNSALILDMIDRNECDFYTDYFFTLVNTNFYLLIEDRYRKQQSEFLDYIESKERSKKYTNEEICVFYLVWILGRKTFLSNEKNVNASKFVSDAVINSYLDAIDVCLYDCFFSTDLATVRMLYLTSIYHSTMNNRNASWQLMTSTCLKCVGLGYNRNCVIEKYTDIEQEEMRLAWWACFRYHMNGCIILGRLPNISLYEVDVDLPNMNHCKDNIFKAAFLASINLFKLMFPILKNREYLNESKDPWGDKNINNVLEIKSNLFSWKNGLWDRLLDYQNDRGERHLIKLHLLYHHCIMALLVPYLIAYALKPNDKNAKSPTVIDSLASCINSAIELVKVVKVSSSLESFNNLLWYDLFYAYNSLMVLLLGLRLIRSGSEDPNTKDFNVLKHTLKTVYGIDTIVLIKTINDIKEVNDAKGGESKTVMRDASNNIKLLLKHFKLENIKEKLSGKYETQRRENDLKRNNPHLQPIYMTNLNSQPKSTFIPQSDLRNYSAQNTSTSSQPSQSKYPTQQQLDNFNLEQRNSLDPTFQATTQPNFYQDTELVPNSNVQSMENMFNASAFSNTLNKDGLNDVDFFNVLDNINTTGETQAISLGINDKLFWDWNKLFNEEN